MPHDARADQKRKAQAVIIAASFEEAQKPGFIEGNFLLSRAQNFRHLSDNLGQAAHQKLSMRRLCGAGVGLKRGTGPEKIRTGRGTTVQSCDTQIVQKFARIRRKGRLQSVVDALMCMD